MHAWAVIPAGGTGSRFSAGGDKLFAPLAGAPVLARTLTALLAADRIQGAVIAIHPRLRATAEALVSDLVPNKPVMLTSGGDTRRDSVEKALQALPQETPFVAIHDAARPLIRPALADAAIAALQADPALAGMVVAQRVHDTLKRADATGGTRGQPDVILATVDRAGLWRAQTPQIFRLAALRRAYQAARDATEETVVTDDAQLLERAGLGPVGLWPGEARNLKITAPEDLRLAEALWSLDNAP